MIHRELLSSTNPNLGIHPTAKIDIAPEEQIKGTAWVGGWPCGPDAYKAVLRAYLIDRHGNQSNTLDYLIVCSGAAGIPKS